MLRLCHADSEGCKSSEEADGTDLPGHGRQVVRPEMKLKGHTASLGRPGGARAL